MTYTENRAWSDRYIPAIKTIVGPFLIDPAPLELDWREATDLIVLNARDMRIAARLRKPDILTLSRQKDWGWEWQFTIRLRVKTGAPTELQKIIDGFGDWMFYAHVVDEYSMHFDPWMLINLHAFRAALIRDGNGRFKLKWGDRDNGDGTHFRWFDVRSFPADPPLLIGSEGLTFPT